MSRRLTRAELIGLLRGARVTRIPIEEAADMLEADDAYAGLIQKAAQEVADDLEYGVALRVAENYEHQFDSARLRKMQEGALKLRAALAKNPNPSGHVPAEASGAPSGPSRTAEASGPVGLGPINAGAAMRDGRTSEIGTVGSQSDSPLHDNALTVALQDALRNSNAALSLLSAYASDLDRQAINSQLAINYGVLARSPLLVRDVPRTVASQEKK